MERTARHYRLTAGGLLALAALIAAWFSLACAAPGTAPQPPAERASTVTPTPSVLSGTPVALPTAVGPQTVAVALHQGQWRLKVGNRVYEPADVGRYRYESPVSTLQAVEIAGWTPLVDLRSRGMHFGVFSYSVLPGNLLAFTTREDDDFTPYLSIPGQQALTRVSLPTGNRVQTAVDATPGGTYLTYATFTCWNCAAPPPEIVLYERRSGRAQNLGQAVDVHIEDDGRFVYRPLGPVPCRPGGAAECLGPTLELRSGSF